MPVRRTGVVNSAPQIESFVRASIAPEFDVRHPFIAPRSHADIVWDNLACDEVTAVFDTTEAGWPSASADDTVQLHVPGNEDDLDDAPRVGVAIAANDAPTQVGPELAPESAAVLLLQLAAEGYHGEGRPIAVHLIERDGFVDVGCECEGPWASDAYLDAWHVRLSSAAGGVRVWDEGDRGGVWLRLDSGRWLLPDDRVRIGAQLLRFDELGSVQLVVDDEPVGLAVPVVDELVLGREAADATFPHDRYVSAQHCRFVAAEDGVWIEDLSSSNGTWVRARSDEVIPFGSIVAMGASLYRIESGEP